MMEELIELDKAWFLKLNDLHSPNMDFVMYWISQTKVWIPLYALLLFLCYINYKKWLWIPLIAIGITILCTDQVTSGLMKTYFERWRPSHDPDLEGLVHIVNNYRGGLYGFASSHAANTFGIATFFFLSFKEKYKWVWLLFIWALLVSYTRIYLGVHFPGDIIAGAAVGLGGGYLGYAIAQILEKRYHLPRSPRQEAQ